MCQGQFPHTELSVGPCSSILLAAAAGLQLAQHLPQERGKDVWGQESRVAFFPSTPQSTGQSYSHKLKEAPCLKHCMIIILALWVTTHFLNPLSKHPLITSVAMRIQGVKTTLGDLSVKNFLIITSHLGWGKKEIYGKGNNSFAALRLSVSVS